MTTVYIAASSHFTLRELGVWDYEAHPMSVLISYAYLANWRNFRAKFPLMKPTRLMLDSGAFTAFNRGTVVDVDALIEETKSPEWNEAVALDVIGSAEGSRKNADYMRARGSRAFPVFHIGEDWSLLDHYCDHWPKVGLSCRFGEPLETSLRFYEQAFARRWPHAFHSFGWIQQEALLRFPFHSADASSPTITAMHRMFAFKGRGRFLVKRKVPGVSALLSQRGQNLFFARILDMERYLKDRWAREMITLGGVR